MNRHIVKNGMFKLTLNVILLEIKMDDLYLKASLLNSDNQILIIQIEHIAVLEKCIVL